MVNQEEARKILEEIIVKARRDGKSVVIVGNSIEGKIEGIDDEYFIKMSARSLENAYRRLLTREIKKIADRSDEAYRIIATENVNDIGPVLSNVLTPAIWLAATFKTYKEIYEKHLDVEKSRGTLILTQPEILRRILFSRSDFTEREIF